ncbi:DUF4232 domain-containing protein [Nocardia terpenica]|uniref:DUF4232 domain-containing protein n=1 Tax=Nocardia terpenica TaxID=455432 RepID=UPI000311D163|nr:DUF4232 domain-containing protein [Nocardia terpenica]NQE85768.1 DUF4232 domain-containing protein [Nocardia terpenica]
MMPISPRYRMIRLAAGPAAVLVGATLALTACSSGGGAGGATTAGGAGTSAAPSASAAASGSGGGAPATSPATESRWAEECATSQLSVAKGQQGVGAGQLYVTVVFTNSSGIACALTGYPGVSYVTESGDQSGNPATRAEGPVQTVTLQPGDQASALLHDSNGIGGYDPAQCKLSPAAGLRIYPPDQTASLFLPWQTQHCAGPDIHSLTIGPIHPGTAPRG